MSKENYEIFISFKDRDNESNRTPASWLAAQIFDSLDIKGYSVFYSRRVLPGMAGGEYEPEIDNALETAKLLVLVFSNAEEVNSEWVKYEWKFFLKRSKPILTVFMDCGNASMENLPHEIKKLQYCDLTNDSSGRQYDLMLQKIDEIMFAKKQSSSTSQYQQKESSHLHSTQSSTNQSSDRPANTPMSVNVGDRITFGQYPQGTNGEVEPLKWRVLDVRGDKALLITEKIIDYVSELGSSKNREKYTWETSSLRRWLNHVFIGKAFNWNQQQKIITVSNSNPDDAYSDGEEYVTEDNIFALSVNEAQRYFSTDDDRKAPASDYAELHCRSSCPWDDKEAWWLRSPFNALTISKASYVSKGCIKDRYQKWSSPIYITEIGIRPAMWISLS